MPAKLKNDMPRLKQKYQPQKIIAVDVDHTLFTGDVLNEKLAMWCKEKKKEGYVLMLWSTRGEEYAKEAAIKAKMIDVFDYVIGKPGYIVDDMGWDWTRYTKIIHGLI